MFCPQAEVIHIRGGDFTHVPLLDHLRSMVDNQVTVARKHLPTWQASIFFWLEQVQLRRLSFTYKTLRILLPHGMTALIRKKGAFR